MSNLCFTLPESVSIETQRRFLQLMAEEGDPHYDWSPSAEGLIKYYSCDEHRITDFDKADPNVFAKQRNDHDIYLFNRVNPHLKWEFADSQIAKLFNEEILGKVEKYFSKIYRVVLVSLKPNHVFRFHRDWFYMNDYDDIPARVKGNWDVADLPLVDTTLHNRQDYLAFKIPLRMDEDQANRIIFKHDGKYKELQMGNNIFLFNEIEFHCAAPGGQMFGVIFIDGEMKMDKINSNKTERADMLKEVSFDEAEIDKVILQNKVAFETD